MRFARESTDSSYLPPGVLSRNLLRQQKNQTRLKEERSRLRRLSTRFSADNSVRRADEDPYEGSEEVAGAMFGLIPQPVLVASDPADEANAGLARNAVAHLEMFRSALTPMPDGGYSEAALERIRDVNPMPPGVKIEYRVMRPTGEDSPLESLL